MMNCWKSVNVQREVGMNRIYLLSFLVGVLSFIFLFLPFAAIHQGYTLKDQGIFPLLIGLTLLPIVHKIVHFIPLLVTKRTFKLKCRFNKMKFPIISVLSKASMSKRTSIITLLAPTVFLTLPGLIASYLYIDYFAYFLIFSSVNIGISYTDFIYTGKFIRAPRKCIVENDGTGYDILV